jgi:hypothetical protein
LIALAREKLNKGANPKAPSVISKRLTLCLFCAVACSLTINPPLYGADTPMSLFDEKLPYGWNLRDLGCLLKQPHIPQVPGVTTPMTYFGMWKSFFAWHVVS